MNKEKTFEGKGADISARDQRKNELAELLAQNKIESGDAEWDKKFLEEYEGADWSLTYRINRDDKLATEGESVIKREGEKEIDVVARLALWHKMRDKLPHIHKEIQKRVLHSNEKKRDDWKDKMHSLVGSEQIEGFKLARFFESKKEQGLRQKEEAREAKELLIKEKKEEVLHLLKENPEVRRSVVQKIVDKVGYPFELIGRGALYVMGIEVDENDKIVSRKS